MGWTSFLALAVLFTKLFEGRDWSGSLACTFITQEKDSILFCIVFT
jgi:hypothetical protein